MLCRVNLLDLSIVVPLRIWIELSVLLLVIAFVLWWVISLREKKIREIEATKTELEKLRSENYKAKLEREQINNFFSTSLLVKNDVDEILWDVTKNLIAKLDFEDCLIYMWNEDKTRMVQRAGFGVKDSKEILVQFPYDLAPGEGIVGTVAQSGSPVIVPDTRKDPRYVAEGYSGLSEIAVPIKYEEELLGVIDSEHSQPGFFNENHLQLITTIGTLMASKIKAIEADQQLRKQKAEIDNISKQLIELRLAALRSQMNPHFIFNALNSIKKFVLSNDVDNADIYLGKFSRLMRSILNNSREDNISLEKELEMLTLYLELEKLRFGKKLDYSIHVDPSLREGTVFIPTMIVQPFIENAMLHGIMHKDCCGEIHVSFIDRENHIEVKVKDNGIGRKAAAQIAENKNDGHTSMGIEVTRARLKALSTDVEVPSGVEIFDLEDNGISAGTVVKICIPQ
jgi:GAF domain-containing protein